MRTSSSGHDGRRAAASAGAARPLVARADAAVAANVFKAVAAASPPPQLRPPLPSPKGAAGAGATAPGSSPSGDQVKGRTTTGGPSIAAAGSLTTAAWNAT